MKTFLETHSHYSRSFILYGNLNDDIWCGDLAVRGIEQFLTRFLKSRGYEHIIFYGDSATKGAYCLDWESAKFFFDQNQTLPAPARFDPMENASVPAQEKAGQRSPTLRQPAPLALGGRVHRARSRSSYRPGDPVPGAARQASETVSGSESVSPQASGTAPDAESDAPTQARYSQRDLPPHIFLMRYAPMMLDASSKMAIIFYNLFSNEISRPMQDYILHGWEQQLGGRNLCLLLADTSQSEASLADRLRALGLASKFTRQGEDGRVVLNPDTCVEIGPPGGDEIRNMLRRYRMVGSMRSKRTIQFPYERMDDIVTEILFCSRNGKASAQEGESMRAIAGRIEEYVESQPGRGPLDFSPDTADIAWGLPPRDRTGALEKLNRPGWEKPYQAMSRLTQAASRNAAKPTREAADWAVSRFRTEAPTQAPRQNAPNFVLLGSPGVGKTTIARQIGEILREEGILKVGTVVEATRENLTSSYIAGVPKATMNCVNRAEEGVLFIDEAHALGRKDGGANHEGTGKEVVSTLNSAMTDPNRHFSVILAGYKDDMEAVWRLDDGFRRRFGEENIIEIDDYPPELLERILCDAIAERGFRMDSALTEERTFGDVTARPLSCCVSRIYQERDRRTFGNAGTMESLALRLCGTAKNGVVTQENFYGVQVTPDSDSGVITSDWFSPSDVGNSLERILDEIRGRFVGMERIEQYFSRKAREIEEALKMGGSEEDIPLRPMLLIGNPGTGKTSVANLLARLYCHFHLLGTSQTIEVSGSTLASSFTGGTQEKVLEYVKRAQERKALLFVDEAHQFVTSHFDGEGALKAFMNPLTDRKHPFMAVFAVYPNMLEKFLALDSGADRRFERLVLEDYTGAQLFAILQKMMEKNRPPLTFSAEAEALSRRVCNYIYVSRTEQTGNAGRIERLLEEMNFRRRERCHNAGLAIGSPEYARLEPSDIPPELVSQLPPEDASTEEIMRELDALCGLESVKREVRDLVHVARNNRFREQQGLPVVPMSLHMAFLGNPGTGKTSVARLIGRLYQSIGLLSRGQLVEVQRADLVAGYVGQTAIKTQEAFDRAIGGALFIDEAYTLASGGANDFGQEAIDTLLKNMEDHRDDALVIAAGYDKPMERFLQSNPGLLSRFSKVLHFDDYSTEELLAIFKALCKQGGYALSEEAETVARRRIEAENGPSFGNGRGARNLFERVLVCQAKRLSAQAQVTKEVLMEIRPEDFEAV